MRVPGGVLLGAASLTSVSEGLMTGARWGHAPKKKKRRKGDTWQRAKLAPAKFDAMLDAYFTVKASKKRIQG